MLAQNKFVLRMVKLEMDREYIWVIHITDGHEYGFFKKNIVLQHKFFLGFIAATRKFPFSSNHLEKAVCCVKVALYP